MSWEQFIYFAMAAILLWAIGAWAAWKGKTGFAYTATIVGLVVFFSFILSMWISLERPPLRTMGETRLWYSFFLPLAGFIVYSRWKYKWILTFSTILALVFISVNLFKPEIHDKTLMPALQSPWFAPHVIVYMFAYAVLGAATVMAVYLLFIKKKTTESTNQPIADEESDITDNLVYVGLAFLTIGMLFGALWAKLPSLPSACSSVLSGPRRHGDTTGRGTPRRRGRPSPGCPILSMCTIVTFHTIVSALLSGCSSSLSSSCRCAGGASIICPLPKAPAYTPIA